MSVTEKVSITIGRQELGHARRLASRLGLSLSTFITTAVRERIAEQDRREAAAATLASFPAEDRATAEEMTELLERWGAPWPTADSPPRSPRRRVAGATRARAQPDLPGRHRGR